MQSRNAARVNAEDGAAESPPEIKASAGRTRAHHELSEPPDDARLAQVVGRHLHFDAIANGQAHPAFAHLSADGGEHEMFVVEFDPKHGAGQHSLHTPFYFNMLFFHTGQHWPDPLQTTTSRRLADRTRPKKSGARLTGPPPKEYGK